MNVKASHILQHEFEQPELLQRALTHASHADARSDCNERLEFLGDSLLGMTVCEHLFRSYPSLQEGAMTKIKSTVVSRRTCAAIANEIGLSDLLMLGKGMRTGPRIPSSVAAAAFEAVIGALYLDAGLEKTQAFILRHVQPYIDDAAESAHQGNYKSLLQQVAQRHLPWTPQYELVGEEGPDHRKSFVVRVDVFGHSFEPGRALSKKAAEQKAALAALNELRVLIGNAADGTLGLAGDAEIEAALTTFREARFAATR